MEPAPALESSAGVAKKVCQLDVAHHGQQSQRFGRKSLVRIERRRQGHSEERLQAGMVVHFERQPLVFNVVRWAER